MADYKVKKRFRDIETQGIYLPGDTFKTDDQDRAASALKRGLIEKKSKQPPKKDVKLKVDDYHVGGGYYELPDGKRIRGKQKAEKALKTLD